ncbi:MAG: hypothetical protein KJO30_11820 [Boseongicola sp.]|jgi:hypothetical protein|nr:hypothetical protein [Boseongicola sp.]
MDMLPLVPVVLLGAVGVWLLWPVIVDPLTSNVRAKRRAAPDHADGLADGLFGVWRENAEKVGVIEPTGRG